MKFFPGWLAWRTVAGLLAGLLLLLGLGVWIGRIFWPRLVVQPITREVEKLVPGKTITERIPVPGPIRFVTRTVTKEVIREVPRYVLVTRPPESLSPAELEQARKVALRRFILSMEIPAGQLIPCATPSLATGGMVCAEAISFQAELLEPAPGVIVPIKLPGQIAQPKQLRVEARPEATTAVRSPGWYVYPIGVRASVLPQVATRLVTGLSYRTPLWRGAAEVRAECVHPGLEVWSCTNVDLWLAWGMTF